MSLLVNSVPGVCVCVIMSLLPCVFKSCLLSSMSSGLLVIPGVSVCLPYLDVCVCIALSYLDVCVCIALSYLDVVIKDYYFEVSPRLRVPRFSLLCAP